jgi:hypothetical protein
VNGDTIGGRSVFNQPFDALFGNALFFADKWAGDVEFFSELGWFNVASALKPDPVLFG